jgi:hypothetical protein
VSEPLPVSELTALRALSGTHHQVAKALFTPTPRPIYHLDFVLVAALNRSLCLLKAFASLIDARNLVAAAPLLRLQIDTCLRLHACTLVADLDQFAAAILGGASVRDLRDRSGNKMADRYLLDSLAQHVPGLTEPYEHTNGYVHLSSKHIFNSLGVPEAARNFVPGMSDLPLNLKVSDDDHFVTTEAYREFILYFHRVTSLLLEMVRNLVPVVNPGKPPGA